MKINKTVILAVLFFPAAAFGQEIGNIQALDGYDYAGPELKASDVKPEAVLGENLSYDPAQGPALLVSAVGGSYVVDGIRDEINPADPETYTWEAMTIKPELLDETYWGYEGGGIGHSFLTFSFKKGGVTDPGGKDISGLVFSAEARYLKGEPYAPFTLGVQDHYPLLWVLASWESFAEYELRNNTRDLSLFPLKLTPAEKLAMLKIAIREGVKDRSGEFYNTFTRSCTNMPMNVLGESVGKDFRFFKTLPSAGVAHLKAAKLISEGVKLVRENWQDLEIRPSERK